MKKTLLIGVLLVALLAGIGAWFLFSNLDSRVAGMIEDRGEEVTRTDVSVAGVELQLREGRGTISGLTVASPDGYGIGPVFTLGDITLDIQVDSIREDPIVLEEVRIRAPEIRVEFAESGDSNLEEIRQRANSRADGEGGDANGAARAEKRLRIREFVVEAGRIEVDASRLGLGSRGLDLPALGLQDVGGPDGAPSGAIAATLLAEIARQATREVAGSELERRIRDELGDSVVDRARGLLEGIGN